MGAMGMTTQRVKDIQAAGNYGQYFAYQDWFMIAWNRELPELLPMPVGLQLNLGAGYRMIGDSVPLDVERGWNADTDRIPCEDDSVAGIWAHGFFEHVKSVPAVLMECQRVLMPGGVLNVVVPHGRSEIAVEDLDHKQFIVEHSWRNLFTNEYYDAGCKADRVVPWRIKIHANFMMAVAYRNMALFTQFVKV